MHKAERIPIFYFAWATRILLTYDMDKNCASKFSDGVRQLVVLRGEGVHPVGFEALQHGAVVLRGLHVGVSAPLSPLLLKKL